MSFLSSSDINRCKRNGLIPYGSYTVEEWVNYFHQRWVNRKLRRKLYTLYRLDILSIKRENFGFIGVSGNEDWYKEMVKNIQKQFLDAEDRAILGGNSNE